MSARGHVLATLVLVLVVGAATHWLGPSRASAQQFRRPTACDGCIANWFYFDENSADGVDDDWNCAGSSYDGHRGSDFSLAGGNGAIDTGYDVVAAADGVVETATDGFYDHCTSCPAAGADSMCGLGFGSGFGNHVRIRHGSTYVVYAHMRTGSIRVSPGDTVTCGQVIGQIGSSGCTTGAHLHFEPRTSTAYTSAFDPFQGPCSPTSPSRWVSQGPHRGMPAPSCDGSPPPPTCPSGWYTIWTCSGSQRRRCIDGVQMTDECGPGTCESRPVGTDDVCDADSDSYATDEGDCDDHDGAVHPGAREVCGNGKDDDCSGGDEACPMMPDASVTPMIDAAVIGGADAWSLPPDAYVPPGVDAGPLADAARPAMDAGRPRDTGPVSGGGHISGGCGCRAPHGGAGARGAVLTLLLAALALRRRRR
ncbi:MAG: peptidoglycan DD-metalloendopeptidase family protein [Sandaracinaceae bacterium]|nr:peptidoglycan DD-metalloendopeptidase family protein [Sandaracinaceae bacterium]